MRPSFSVTLAGFVGLALAGCAGTNVTLGPSIANPESHAVASRVKPDKASYKRALYIADYGNNDVKIFTNTYYHELGVISDGIANPMGEFIDQHGNLYVANQPFGGSDDVTEYAPGTTSPSFTYNANMVYPQDVTVDRQGNVYEVDLGDSAGTRINEYFQGENRVTQSCNGATVQPRSVAVDATGDVFVSSYNGIYEYKGGLSGCNLTQLNGLFVSGMALDSNNNLIVSVYPGAVDVVDPPYTGISRTIGSGFVYPWGVSVNKKNKFVFVGDFNADTTTVINYQTGQNVKVLSGGSYGITSPEAVTDAPNYIP